MENYGYAMLGEMLIGLGNALKDPKSELSKNFKLSREQMFDQCDRNVSIETVAKHFGVSVKTVERWVKDERKQFPKPKREGFHKMHFKADEIMEWKLYIKPYIDKN